MRRWSFTCVVLLVGSLLAGIAVAQPPAVDTPADTISESTTVIAVEVPVTVVRKGEAALDLDREDFEVLIDGEVTPISGFDRVDLRLAGARAADAAVVDATVVDAARRHLLLVFDLALTAPDASRRGVAAAREILASGLHPSDRVAVGVYGETVGARLLSGFTEDRARTGLALRALSMIAGGGGRGVVKKVRALVAEAGDQAGEGLRQLAADAPSFLKLQGRGVVDSRSLAGEALAGLAPGGGGLRPDGVAETLADMERGYQRETRPAMVRTQSFRFLETLSDLAEALQDIRGQRFLVLFTAGLEERVLEARRSSSGASALHRILKVFARTGWQVHAMAVGAHQSLTGRSMGFLTDATSGHAYRNMAPVQALGHMIEQTSVAYVLTVQPADPGAPGSFHPIEVRLRHGHGEVRHRAGFRTPSAWSLGAGSFDALAVGGEVATWEDGGAIGTRALAVPFKESAGGASEARVPLLVELAGSDLRERAGGEPLQLIVDAYLLVPPSGVVPLFTQPLVLDPVRHAAAFSSHGGVKLYANVSLPAGEHRLRVVVRDPVHQERTVASLAVSVPRFGSGVPQVLPPIYPEIEDRWLNVGHTASSSVVDDSFPFQFEHHRFLPQVKPQVVAGTPMPVFLAAVDLPDRGAALRLVLETAAGEPVPGYRLQVNATTEEGDDGLLRVMANLDTAGLAPGRYRLRLVWSDAQTGVVREAWKGFSVVSGQISG